MKVQVPYGICFEIVEMKIYPYRHLSSFLKYKQCGL